VTAPGNPEGSCCLAMPQTTAEIGIQLLRDSTVSLQEIEAESMLPIAIAIIIATYPIPIRIPETASCTGRGCQNEYLCNDTNQCHDQSVLHVL
jgi:hypothetical protein